MSLPSPASPPPLQDTATIASGDPAAPTVPSTGPPGTLLVELLIFNGSQFKDHWSYFIRSRSKDSLGVVIHATGDVRNGFTFEIKRNYDLEDNSPLLTKRIPLEWIAVTELEEKAMMNNGVLVFDTTPVWSFEESVYQIKAPGKSLNSVTDTGVPRRKVVQRDCQTWIVESGDQLLKDGIFRSETVAYLYAIKQ